MTKRSKTKYELAETIVKMLQATGSLSRLHTTQYVLDHIINEIDEYTLFDSDGNILTDGYIRQYSHIDKHHYKS